MADRAQLDRTIQALARNQMEGILVENPSQLRETILRLVPKGSLVSCGGSVTLGQTGVMDLLREGSYRFLDREGKTNEEKEALYREVFSADAYFTSTNAITENGELYNVDGRGNRVAAMIFGPKRVIVVAGANKIVPDVHAAVKRLRAVAAPLNAKRLDLATGCRNAGRCVDCRSPQRICCDYVKIGFQQDPQRIKVLLLPEEYGY